MKRFLWLGIGILILIALERWLVNQPDWKEGTFLALATLTGAIIWVTIGDWVPIEEHALVKFLILSVGMGVWLHEYFRSSFSYHSALAVLVLLALLRRSFKAAYGAQDLHVPGFLFVALLFLVVTVSIADSEWGRAALPTFFLLGIAIRYGWSNRKSSWSPKPSENLKPKTAR